MAQIETFEGLPIVDTGGRSLISALDAKKISFPNDGADFGNSGDQLRSLGNGGVEWAAPGMPTYEQTEQAISDWLGEHPEATTTVQDGSITDAKLSDTLKDALVWDNELNSNLLVFTHAPQYIQWDWGTGNCFVLKTKSNKVVLFDLGEVATHDSIIQTMTDMGIDHIDYVIISHYHSDHVNEFQPISEFSDHFDMSNTVFYLQKDSALPVFKAYGERFRALISDYEQIFPNNGDVLRLDDDDITISFYNCSDVDVQHYDTIADETKDWSYNYYSMINYIETDGVCIFITADLDPTAQAWSYDCGYIKKVDVMQVPHHGIDNYCNYNFINATAPKYAVIPGACELPNKSGGVATYLSALECRIYNSGIETVAVAFDKNELHIQDYNLVTDKFNRNSLELHIQSSSTENFCDGSTLHPFKTINQALRFAYRYKDARVDLVFDESYDNPDETVIINKFPNVCYINKNNANVRIRELIVEFSDFAIGKIELYNTGDSSLNIKNSNGFINTLILNGDTTGATVWTGRGMFVSSSVIQFGSVEINNKISAMQLENSYIRIDSLKGSGNTYAFIDNFGSDVFINKKCLNDKLDASSIFNYQRLYYRQCENKNLHLLEFTEVIEENNDLNTKVYCGTYCALRDGIVSTIVNKPNSSMNRQFYLIVDVAGKNGNNYLLRQTLLPIDASQSNSNYMYIRTSYNTGSTWSNWYNLG